MAMLINGKKNLLTVFMPVAVLLLENWVQSFQTQNSTFILSLVCIIGLVRPCVNFKAHLFPAAVFSYEIFPTLFAQRNINK